MPCRAVLCLFQAFAANPTLAGLQMQPGLAAGQLLAATGIQQQQVYDPLAGMDVNKLNSIFIQRQQPSLTGAFTRPM